MIPASLLDSPWLPIDGAVVRKPLCPGAELPTAGDAVADG
jgi:hypothetical protein